MESSVLKRDRGKLGGAVLSKSPLEETGSLKFTDFSLAELLVASLFELLQTQKSFLPSAVQSYVVLLPDGEAEFAHHLGICIDI